MLLASNTQSSLLPANARDDSPFFTLAQLLVQWRTLTRFSHSSPPYVFVSYTGVLEALSQSSTVSRFRLRLSAFIATVSVVPPLGNARGRPFSLGF